LAVGATAERKMKLNDICNHFGVKKNLKFEDEEIGA